ncbi:MAG: hypothetical protein IT343_09470 [Candidatus Melainabacteria bacterium]|jgi:hypothetical protein|nr:hypothetical protein [Candidatus Melainabacteria bacterium]
MGVEARKLEAVANLIEGRVVDDSARVEVCIKGSLLGFPVTMEAFRAGFPFGVTYFLEIGDLGEGPKPVDPDALCMTFYPRMTRGFYSFFARLLLLESKGQPIDEPRIKSNFLVSYNSREKAERFVHFPGVLEKVLKLEHYAKFGELVIRTDAGISLSQPQNFNSLEMEVIKESFNTISELGQIMFDNFQ